jgi:hypothetical protein
MSRLSRYLTKEQGVPLPLVKVGVGAALLPGSAVCLVAGPP